MAIIVAAGVFSGTNAKAVTISWGSQLNIAGDTDVATSGTLVYAYNIRNATYTVNGVTFAAGNSFTSLGSGNVTLSGFTNKVSTGASPNVAGNISANYSAMLGGFAYSSPVGVTTGTVTLNNLTVGKEYLVQIWVADYRKDTNARTQSLDHGPVTLHYMTGNGSTAGSGTGQYSIGLFKASGTSQSITLTANESLQINAIQVRDVTPTGTGTTYYVDPAGDDSNNGTGEATPWKSISKVNGTTFQPGDKILFKRGGTWSGTLSPKGAGTDAAQNTLGSYGSGAKPLIDGAGAGAVISISGQSYWTIDGFEVTNFAGGAGGNRSGIRVGGGGDGSTIRRIRILNNDVHDIQATPNVNDGARNWGGIFVWIDEPGKADDVLIEGNTSTGIQGQGISFWGEFESAGGGMNYNNCSPHVVVRGNRVWRTSGDGILMLGTDNELVEYNEVAHAGGLSGLYNNIAAAWPSRHRNGVWQYNHVHHTKWLEANDSTAFDNDGFVEGTTYFQYNYSHDNEGGFHMEYFWVWDYGKTVSRYNISVNDGRGTYARVYFSNRPGSELYNNVFYNPGMTLDVSNGGDDIHTFRNNIFVGADLTTSFSRQGVYYNNSFNVGITPPDSSNGNLAHDPKFMNANTIGDLAGFILQATSPCRSTGQVITGNGGKDFWSVALPTTAPHRGAGQINSIGSYTSTPSYVHVSGPFSVVVPFSGGTSATFAATVHDQNFQPLAAPSVTWALSPSVAGCSINSSGQVTLSSAAAGQRFAVTATSGTGSHTFSFSTAAPVWTNSAGTGIWNTTDANWSGQAWADGGDAVFAHTSAAQTVTLFGARSAAAVRIGNGSNNANYTFTSGSGASLTASSITVQGAGANDPGLGSSILNNLTLATPGDVRVGRWDLIFSGNSVVNIGGQLRSTADGNGPGDWGRVTLQDNANVTATGGVNSSGSVWGLTLNGGTLTTPSIRAAENGYSAGSRLTFNGTTVIATQDNPNFITVDATGQAYVGSGEAKFDTAGHDIGIGIALQGGGGLTKSGAGSLTLSGGWNYTGPTNILGGTLASGAAAGTSNSLAALTLNGGSLSALNAGDANLGNFQLRGDVTVGGSSTSLISADVRVVSSETRTFTVAPTGDLSGIDLLVSGKLGHHNGSAWGFATKAGEGVMKISGVNEIGSLTVNTGKLILENSGIGGMWNGGLISNAQTELSVTGSNTVSFGQAIQGGGSITKTGTGTLELSAVSSHTGGTTVNDGKLILATGGASGTGRIRGALTINANGTVETTGDGTGLGWVDQISAVTLNGGALTSAGTIHIWNIPGGISMIGGLLQSSNGTSDPNGPQLEWNRTNVTTHASASTATIAGRIRMRNDGSYSGITFTVADGSAATDLLVSAALTEASGGMGITKNGPGTMTLTGTNNYTGQTLVNEGTLRANGSLGGAVTVQANGTLAPGASVGTLTVPSATITGALAIELDGGSADRLNATGNLNITNATLALTGTPTGSELIIASFGSLTGAAFATVTGLPGGYQVTYDLAGKQIKLTALATGFAGWIGPFGVSNPAANADPDFDGIPNALEYVLGGDPSQPASSIAPTVATSGGNLVFTFQRADASETSDITLAVEAGTTLGTWPETYTISPGMPSAGVSIQENGTAPDTIAVSIPQNTAKFARLRVIVSP